jgi:hypothetical protein
MPGRRARTAQREHPKGVPAGPRSSPRTVGMHPPLALLGGYGSQVRWSRKPVVARTPGRVTRSEGFHRSAICNAPGASDESKRSA